MCLRHLVIHFKWRKGTENTKDFPIQVEQRDVDKWVEGTIIRMDPTKKYLLCNRKDIKKMVVCYVILDPEYFILISPVIDSKQQEETIKIDYKWRLQNVSSVVDIRTDSWNLLLNFNYLETMSSNNPISE